LGNLIMEKPTKLFSRELNFPSIVIDTQNLLTVNLILVIFSLGAIFFPLSFLETETLRSIWSATIIAVWMVAALAGAFRIAHLYFKKAYNQAGDWLFLPGFYIIFSLWLSLHLLGLFPTDYFIPNYIIITFIILHLFYYFQPGIFIYKSFLVRSLKFVEIITHFCIILFVVIAVVRLFSIIGFLVDFSLSNLPALMLAIAEFIAACLIIRDSLIYVYKININDKTAFLFQITKLAIIVAVLEGISIAVNHNIIYIWFALFALLSSVLYIAQNPTKKKSSTPLYIGILLFCFFYTTELFYPSLLNKFPQGFLINNILVFISLAIGMYPIIRTKIFEKKKQALINDDDIQAAYEELNDTHGFSLDFINYITRISIISDRFQHNHDILECINSNRNDFDRELATYFKIYCLSAEFIHKNAVSVYGEDENGAKPKRKIISSDEFKDYITQCFPNFVSDLDLWKNYQKNEYIKLFIDHAQIKDAKPPSKFDTVKKVFNAIIVIFIFVSFSLGQIPAPAIQEFGKLLSETKSLYILNSANIKLKFTGAFRPYRDEEWGDYYASSIYNWANTWINNSNSIEENTDQYIKWLNLILNFYKKKDKLFNLINYNLGTIYYNFADDIEKAIHHLSLCVANEEHDEYFDIYLSGLSQIYLNQNERDKAIKLIEKYLDIENINRSKILLSENYFILEKYNLAYDLLVRIPNNDISEVGNAILSICSYKINGEIAHSKFQLKDFIENADDGTPTKIVGLSLYFLGEIYFNGKDYFQASDYLYRALALQIMRSEDYLSDANQAKAAKMLEDSSKKIILLNPKDYRVNLWLFTAYLMTNNMSEASKYLNYHFEQSPESFESEFTDFIKRSINNQ
jgi:hypothetical protein